MVYARDACVVSKKRKILVLYCDPGRLVGRIGDEENPVCGCDFVREGPWLRVERNFVSGLVRGIKVD